MELFYMANKKILLSLILLSFIAGSFSIQNSTLEINFEVKYLFISIFTLLIFINKIKVFDRNVLYSKDSILFLISLYLYYLMLLLSVFYSADKFIAINSYIYLLFIVFLIVGVIVVIPFFDKQEYFMFISGVLIVFGIIYSIPIIFQVLLGANRGDFNLSGPNVATRILFFALCSSIYRQIVTKNSRYLLISLLFLTSIVFVGSRGGIVGATSTLFLVWIIRSLFVNRKLIKQFRFSFRGVLYVGLTTALFIMFYDSLYRVFTNRFINTIFRSDGIYTSGRDILYEESISMIKEKPILGHGINGFSIRTGEVYPHNIILEMMNDIGIFGALFFIVFLFYSIYLIVSYRKTNEYIFACLPLYMIVVQMFSGSLYDFRYYFLWTISLLFFKANKNGNKEFYLNNKTNLNSKTTTK